MDEIKIGCQTYTWQMSYEKYSQKLDHIMDVVAKAGFSGIEPEVCMLGPYNPQPQKLADDLAARGLQLGAIGFVCDWRGPGENADERAEADRMIEYLNYFPGAVLALGQMPGKDRSELRERQMNCIAICNDIGKRASDAGIVTAFHPNPPPGSVFRIEEDYKILLDGLEEGIVDFAPDAGHIANGGMDAVAVFRQYRSRIRHIHFKDMDSNHNWVEMGQGIIDYKTIVEDLSKTDYNGWIMIEDESARAEDNPDAVTIDTGKYLQKIGLLNK